MQRLEVSGAVRPIYGSLGFKRLTPLFVVKYFKNGVQATMHSTKMIQVWGRLLQVTCEPIIWHSKGCILKKTQTHTQNLATFGG